MFRIRTVRDARYRYIRNFMPERPFLQLNRYKEHSYPMIPLMRKLHAEGKLTPVQEVPDGPAPPGRGAVRPGADPYEIHNLAGSPEHKQTQERLQQGARRLDRRCERSGANAGAAGTDQEPGCDQGRHAAAQRATALPDSARAAPPRPGLLRFVPTWCSFWPTTSATATWAATGRRRSRRRTSTGWRRRACASPMPTPPRPPARPSRYALLTGEYAWRNGRHRRPAGRRPAHHRARPDHAARLLKQAGYTTGVVGKWHLGLGDGDLDWNGDDQARPARDRLRLLLPDSRHRRPRALRLRREPPRRRPRSGRPDRRSATASRSATSPTGEDHPELLKMHPSHGHDKTIVNGISRIGYMTRRQGGALGRRGHRRHDHRQGRRVHRAAQGPSRSSSTSPRTTSTCRACRTRGSSARAACGPRGDAIQQLDWCVGEVLETLDRPELADNTLVIFTSDNGPVVDDGYQDGSGHDTSGHRCNGALRGGKGGLYEGGTRVPFIARWPGKVPAGKTSASLVSLVDLLATSAALVGKDLKDDDGPDSFNQLPALLSLKPDPPCRESLVIHGQGDHLAIRQGPWKLIPRPRAGQAELYNLESDLAETTNLAAQQPEKVKQLTGLLDRVRKSGRSRPERQ